MPFRDTQLGRFGELCGSHFSTHGDPDMKAAHALAANGAAVPARPSLQAVLGTKFCSRIMTSIGKHGWDNFPPYYIDNFPPYYITVKQRGESVSGGMYKVLAAAASRVLHARADAAT